MRPKYLIHGCLQSVCDGKTEGICSPKRLPFGEKVQAEAGRAVVTQDPPPLFVTWIPQGDEDVNRSTPCLSFLSRAVELGVSEECRPQVVGEYLRFIQSPFQPLKPCLNRSNDLLLF